MRFYRWLLLSVLFPTLVLAAPAVVQTAHFRNQTGVTPTASAVFGSNITAGSAIVAGGSVESISLTTTTTDTLLNVYSVGNAITAFDSSNRSYMNYTLNSLSGADTVTSTLSGNTTQIITVLEISGVPTSSAVDTQAIGSVSTNAAVTFTPQAGSICILNIQNDGGDATPPSGYTSVFPDAWNKYHQMAYKIGVSAGSQTATWTSGLGLTMVLCLKTASAAANPKTMLLMGAG